MRVALRRRHPRVAQNLLDNPNVYALLYKQRAGRVSTTIWVPKGVIHQGPEEDVPEGYVAWLIETRANLELTEAGRRIALLAETTRFGVHPNAAGSVTAG